MIKNDSPSFHDLFEQRWAVYGAIPRSWSNHFVKKKKTCLTPPRPVKKSFRRTSTFYLESFSPGANEFAILKPKIPATYDILTDIKVSQLEPTPTQDEKLEPHGATSSLEFRRVPWRLQPWAPLEHWKDLPYALLSLKEICPVDLFSVNGVASCLSQKSWILIRRSFNSSMIHCWLRTHWLPFACGRCLSWDFLKLGIDGIKWYSIVKIS